MRNETEIKQSIKETHKFICDFEKDYEGICNFEKTDHFFNYDDYVTDVIKKVEYEITLSIVAISLKNHGLRNDLKTVIIFIIKDKDSVNKYNTIELTNIIKIINKINMIKYENEYEYIYKVTMCIMQLTKLEIFVLGKRIIKSDIIRKKLKEHLEYIML